MKSNESNIILIGIIAGIALAAIGVVVLPDHIGMFGWMGDFFLTALRMIIVPLIIATVVSGVTSLGDVRRLRGVGGRTVGFYFGTTALSVMLGLILVLAIQPGVGITLPEAMQIPDKVAGKETTTAADLVMSLIHPNLFAAFAEGQMLPIILFSLFFGAVLTTIGDKGKVLIDAFDALNDVMMKIVGLLLWLAPFGIFGLIAKSFGGMTGAELSEMVGSVAKYTGVVLLGLGIHFLVTLPLICFLIAKRNPLQYLLAMSPAVLTAWSTASSSATLPVTMECTEDRAGVSPKASGFVLPLGATINMDGTALYEGVAVLFIAQAFGIDLSFMEVVIIFLTATMVSIGAAGVPQAGLVMMVIVLNAVGLPLEGIGLILAIDPILDRFRTATNVWGDSIGAAYIDSYLKAQPAASGS